MKTNRSKVVSWFFCPRYRYLKYHYAEKGIQKITPKGPSEVGKAIHAGNALVLTGTPIDTAVATVLKTFTVPKGLPHAEIVQAEGATFIEGVMRAFNRCRFPQLLSTGKILSVEQEALVNLGRDFDFQFRADAIKQEDEGIVIVDFKPTARGDYQFVRSWERNHQILSYVAAAEKLYNQRVLGVRIEGYVKGKRRVDERLWNGEVKIQDTPLCYVFVNEFSGQITPEYQRTLGWTKTPLWETSLSVQEYVEEFLTAEQVEKLFLAPVPEVLPNRRQLESWKTQTFANETRIEISAALVERSRVGMSDERLFLHLLDEHFPQNMDSCYKYGEDFGCEMNELCFNSEVAAAPLESGLYEERIDHHDDPVE